jgi:hypothetical protein
MYVRFTIQRDKPCSLFIDFVKAVEQVRCANDVFLSKEQVQFPTAVTGISALKVCVQNVRNVCTRGRRELPVIVIVIIIIIIIIIMCGREVSPWFADHGIPSRKNVKFFLEQS